jgi:hypothetical protein
VKDSSFRAAAEGQVVTGRRCRIKSKRGCRDAKEVGAGGPPLRDRPSRLCVAPPSSPRARRPTRWRVRDGARPRRRSRRGGGPSSFGPDGCFVRDTTPSPRSCGPAGLGGRFRRTRRDAASFEARHRTAAEASAALAANTTSAATTTTSAATTAAATSSATSSAATAAAAGTLATDQHKARQRLWRQKPRPHRAAR